MDSSGSDFEGGADAGANDIPNMSLVSETDLDNVSDVKPEKGSRSKKVVPGRWRRKAVGDGVVFGEHSLKGEKCGGISIRGRCTIKHVVSLNKAMSDVQKEAVMGTVLRPILKYRSFSTELNLALTLVKCWAPHSKAFRLADRLVLFSIFDVALLTGLPATRERVDFDDDKLITDFGDMVRQRVHEEEEEELKGRKVGKGCKDNRVDKNFIAMMVYLCEKNVQEEQLELWLKLYTWLVLSGLLFPRTVHGAMWELQRYANDVHDMSRYAWTEAMWRYMVHSLDDMQRRMCNPVWFYEHTIRFDALEKWTFSRIASWFEVYHRGQYDAFELVAGVTENEIVPVLYPRNEEMGESIMRGFIDIDYFCYYVEDGEVRDSLHKEKEAHALTCVELELWKARVAKLQSIVGDPGPDADVEPQATCYEHDGVHVCGEMGSPGDDIPHMGGEIWKPRVGPQWVRVVTVLRRRMWKRMLVSASKVAQVPRQQKLRCYIWIAKSVMLTQLCPACKARKPLIEGTTMFSVQVRLMRLHLWWKNKQKLLLHQLNFQRPHLHLTRSVVVQTMKGWLVGM
ncbi:LOW QUALITY PROTEIN: hypothetical protein Cgig2_031476 [Carnegiea gigantea]|uniref:Aminotransferase-like plant mobile domain-containing protein n=1 Tax=Carnegiea gigantea TaxID=171969 RepID=A0A9Q1GZW2_9CARY|nr:LOW QUALITY PROTEIN: hypothetical protein Cgig2_031476 [Carnegiea gigantea]